MDTTRFLEYLHRDQATASLADAIADVIRARRAAAERRAAKSKANAKARARHQMRIAS